MALRDTAAILPQPSFRVSQHTDRLEPCDRDDDSTIVDWVRRTRARFGKEAVSSDVARELESQLLEMGSCFHQEMKRSPSEDILFEPEAEWDKFYQALRVFEDHFAMRNSALRWLVTRGSKVFKRIKNPKSFEVPEEFRFPAEELPRCTNSNSENCPSAAHVLGNPTEKARHVSSTMCSSFYENWSPGYDRVFEFFGFEPVPRTNKAHQKERHGGAIQDPSQATKKFSTHFASFHSSFAECSHVWRVDERKFSFEMFFIGLRRCYADFCMSMLAQDPNFEPDLEPIFKVGERACAYTPSTGRKVMARVTKVERVAFEFVYSVRHETKRGRPTGEHQDHVHESNMTPFHVRARVLSRAKNGAARQRKLKDVMSSCDLDVLFTGSLSSTAASATQTPIEWLHNDEKAENTSKMRILPRRLSSLSKLELRGLVAIASFEKAKKVRSIPHAARIRSSHATPSDDKNPFAYLNRFLKRAALGNTLIPRARKHSKRPTSSLDALPMLSTTSGQQRAEHLSTNLSKKQLCVQKTHSPLPAISSRFASSLDSLPVIQNSAKPLNRRNLPLEPIWLTSSPLIVTSVSRSSSNTSLTSKRKLFSVDSKRKSFPRQRREVVRLDVDSNSIDLFATTSQGSHRGLKKRVISLVGDISPPIQKKKKPKLVVDLGENTKSTSSPASVVRSKSSHFQRHPKLQTAIDLSICGVSTSHSKQLMKSPRSYTGGDTRTKLMPTPSTKLLSDNTQSIGQSGDTEVSVCNMENERKSESKKSAYIEALTFEQMHFVNQMSQNLLGSSTIRKADMPHQKAAQGPLRSLLAVGQKRRPSSNVTPRKPSKQRKLTDCGFFSPGGNPSQTR